MMRLPVLFLAHGSPMNVVLENDFTRFLSTLEKELPTPNAILVVSAHWLARGTWITGAQMPSLIYDFYGFPPQLYKTRYPCPGNPAVAEEISRTGVKVDEQRGLDHGAWSILKRVFPQANIPVLELSLDVKMSPAEHYDFARRLSEFRKQGVLIIGSGNLVHNLQRANFNNMDALPYDWARQFADNLTEHLAAGEHDILIKLAATSLSVPTNDHYLPMLYPLALQEPDEKVIILHDTIQNASISMLSFMIA